MVIKLRKSKKGVDFLNKVQSGVNWFGLGPFNLSEKHMVVI